ncbi:MAG: selenium metabolism-associated LysR family transcriptional regulator [Spirochaetes bacterium]|nr:selenium metabolism-associated LysR family transcriptional regulator [Spirochaetota bacterium]
MNLDYLKTYLEVIKTGSFSEVAKKLSISQPAVSFQIQKLEQDLGVQLIDRKQKTLMMTEAGKRLLAFANIVDTEHQALVDELGKLKETVSGNLVIAASTIPGEYILPPLLGQFKKLHPAVGIQVTVIDSARVIEAMKNGEYDIGFCGMHPECRELEAIKIAEDEIVLIVYPEHPFAGRKHVSFLELSAEPMILRGSTSGTRQSVEMLLLNGGFDVNKLRPALILGSTESLITAVEAKAGIAFVSNLAVRKGVALGLIRTVAVEGLTLKRAFWCIYRKQMTASRLLEAFIVFFREQEA